MAIFRRQSSPTSLAVAQGEAITRFWAWWKAEGAKATTTAILEGAPERMVAPLSQRVKEIHEGLAWELGPGTGTRHVLVVSAEGNAALRAVARRWRQGAPEQDETWSYSDYRLPLPDPDGTVLTIAETEIDLVSASTSARVIGTHLDVTVFHPAFVALPDEQRLMASFLLLETVLVEAALETWLGTVTATAEPPLDPVPLPGLRAVIRELESQFTDGQGEPVWLLMEGISADGDTILAGAQAPLRSTRAPHLDTHVAISVPFADQTPGGLPADTSLPALQGFEDHLNSRLGGSGHIVAHHSLRGVRTLHAYVDSTTPAVEQLRAAVTGWDQGKVTMLVNLDPGWQDIQHLRA